MSADFRGRLASDGRAWWWLRTSPALGLQSFPRLHDLPVLYEGPASRIVQYDAARSIAAKLARPLIQPRDALRKYGYSEAQRALRTAQVLASLGIAAPQMWGTGVSLNPGSRYESVLFLEYLGGAPHAVEFLEASTDAAARAPLLARIARELARMYRHGYHHKDVHLRNVLVRPDLSTVWIDCDLRRVRSALRLRHLRRETLGAVVGKYLHLLRPEELRDFAGEYMREIRRRDIGAQAEPVSAR